jgi:hypothetical protein
MREHHHPRVIEFYPVVIFLGDGPVVPHLGPARVYYYGLKLVLIVAGITAVQAELLEVLLLLLVVVQCAHVLHTEGLT